MDPRSPNHRFIETVRKQAARRNVLDDTQIMGEVTELIMAELGCPVQDADPPALRRAQQRLPGMFEQVIGAKRNVTDASRYGMSEAGAAQAVAAASVNVAAGEDSE